MLALATSLLWHLAWALWWALTFFELHQSLWGALGGRLLMGGCLLVAFGLLKQYLLLQHLQAPLSKNRPAQLWQSLLHYPWLKWLLLGLCLAEIVFFLLWLWSERDWLKLLDMLAWVVLGAALLLRAWRETQPPELRP